MDMIAQTTTAMSAARPLAGKGALVILCTAGAASITGTALPVDGGWTAH